VHSRATKNHYRINITSACAAISDQTYRIQNWCRSPLRYLPPLGAGHALIGLQQHAVYKAQLIICTQHCAGYIQLAVRCK
jgi:hypothetical protein